MFKPPPPPPPPPAAPPPAAPAAAVPPAAPRPRPSAAAAAAAGVGVSDEGANGRPVPSAAQQSPGPVAMKNCRPATPDTYRMSENPCGGVTIERAETLCDPCA